MTNEIYPCLWFDGKAHEAATFYCSIFNHSRILTENPIVSLFELNGKKIMGLNGGPVFKMNPSISMFIHCTTQEECKRIWDQLSEGGTILMPLNAYPWSELYGWIQDKYGFTWQIMKGTEDRMMPAMLFTADQLGRAQEGLDFYTSLFKHSSIDSTNYYPEGSPFAGKLSYAEFKLDGYPMVAMEGPNEHNYTFNEGVSLVVNCQNQDEIDFFWNQLTSDGGSESMCGWCKDKFGVSWQIIPSNIAEIMNDKDHGPIAMQAMFKMKKLDIAALLNA